MTGAWRPSGPQSSRKGHEFPRPCRVAAFVAKPVEHRINTRPPAVRVWLSLREAHAFSLVALRPSQWSAKAPSVADQPSGGPAPNAGLRLGPAVSRYVCPDRLGRFNWTDRAGDSRPGADYVCWTTASSASTAAWSLRRSLSQSLTYSQATALSSAEAYMWSYLRGVPRVKWEAGKELWGG